jgi:putative transposase
MKYENTYLHNYGKPSELVAGLDTYFVFYNHRRPHQSLDCRTQAEVYFQPLIPNKPDNNLPEI